MKSPLTRRQIADLARSIIRDLEQYVANITHWNQSRSDAAPIDCGAERVALLKARECLRMIESGAEGELIDERPVRELVVLMETATAARQGCCDE